MKFLTLSLLTLAIASSSFAQQRGQFMDRQIESAATAIAQSISVRQIHVSMNYTEKQNLLIRLQDVLSALGTTPTVPTSPYPNYPTNPTNPNPYPSYPTNPNYGPRMDVRAFSDDRCQNLITEVKSFDNCSMLSNVFSNRNLWSVSIDGRCIDIADRTFAQSCLALQQIAAQPKITNPVVTLYSDDRCQNLLIGLDPAVNYSTLGPVFSGKNVWSLKVENNCIDIPDTTFSAQSAQAYIDAALGMRRGYGEAIQFYSDDRYSPKFLVAMSAHS